MLCVNKLSNLVFNAKKIMQNTFCFPFFFFLLLKKNKTTQNEMHECYAMQILETKKTKEKKTKSNGHKEQSNETQGPCQKDSIRLSLLRPKLFRCTSSIGVLIHLRMISNSRIGIKVQNLYQFTNEYYRILCLRHRYF